MKEQSIIEVGESRPVRESLEALAQQGVQRQALGRARYARRDGGGGDARVSKWVAQAPPAEDPRFQLPTVFFSLLLSLSAFFTK